MRHDRNRRDGRWGRRAPSFDSLGGSQSTGADFFDRQGNARAEQKARQLCRQVFRTLSVALGGSGDPALQDLSVVAVDPAPDAGRLLVTVAAAPGSAAVAELYAHLARAAGRLRAEVARDIVRKRAPELAFVVIPSARAGEVSP